MARDLSKQGQTLVLIQDGYDKAKCVLPRYPFGRTPKRPVYEQTHSNLDRTQFLPMKSLGPQMNITGVVAHGYGVFLYMADEGMATGASWSLEIDPRLRRPSESRRVMLAGHEDDPEDLGYLQVTGHQPAIRAPRPLRLSSRHGG